MSQSNRPSKPDRSRRRKRLGVFVDWLADGYSDVMLDHIERAVESQDLDIVCFVAGLERTDYPVPRRHLPLAYADGSNIDAALVVSVGNQVPSSDVARYFSRFEPLPIASIAVQWTAYPTVEVDNVTGVREGVAHLIEAHGRRRFAYVRGPDLSAEARERFRAFSETLEAHGIAFDPALSAPGMYMPEQGIDAVQRWLDECKLEFDAVVAANDSMALGALEELTRRGIRVPQDVSIFGFDDSEPARYARPPLSTVRQPTALHVRKAVDLILAQLAGQKVPQLTRIGSELVLRRSCGCGVVLRDSSIPPGRPSLPPIASVGPHLALLGAFGDTDATDVADPALVETFEAAVSGGRSEGFLRRLEALLERDHLSADLSGAFRALGELHRYADRAGETGARDRSRLFDDTAALLAQVAERTQVGERYHAEDRILRLVRANEALAPAIDLPSVQAVLSHTLQQFGIDRCFVCVFEGEDVPAEWARLVIACDRQRSIDLPPGGFRFPARDLLPLDLLVTDRRTTWLVCPMQRRDTVIPGWVIFERTVRDAYLYDGLLDQIGNAHKRVQLLERIVREVRLREIAERERIEKEMRIAADIQTGILPLTRRVDGLEFSAAMDPCTEVGGDYYDIVPVPGGCWIGIGDVAGHGLPTGLVMLMLQSAISGLVRQDPGASPRELILIVNQLLFDNIRRRMRQDEHVTLMLLRYHNDGSLVFAGAHEDFLVYRARDGLVERVTSQGAWVGVLPDIRSLTEESACTLEEDDVLLLYTDGITEALDAENQMYGVERLAAALQRVHAEPVDAIRDAILAEVRAWMAIQRDDVTLVIARQGRRFVHDSV